jgi:hypothetical protein
MQSKIFSLFCCLLVRATRPPSAYLRSRRLSACHTASSLLCSPNLGLHGSTLLDVVPGHMHIHPHVMK